MSWELTGNAGTNPAANFLGTNDNQPLVIKTNGTEVMRINVPDVPSSRLEITAQDGLAITGFQPFVTLRDANAGNARSVVQGVSGDIVFIPDSFIGRGAAMVVKTGSGNVGIGTDSPTAKLEVQGDVVVTGDIQMLGGDVAEDFDVEEDEVITPGAVVSLGDSGSIRLARRPYDTAIIGIVSGAVGFRPALRLDRISTGHPRLPVALVGKVMCLVDASSSPVRAGDLLTSSVIPGYAMRAEDVHQSVGAIVGKALRSLDRGQALLPVLAILQ